MVSRRYWGTQYWELSFSDQRPVTWWIVNSPSPRILLEVIYCSWIVEYIWNMSLLKSYFMTDCLFISCWKQLLANEEDLLVWDNWRWNLDMFGLNRWTHHVGGDFWFQSFMNLQSFFSNQLETPRWQESDGLGHGILWLEVSACNQEIQARFQKRLLIVVANMSLYSFQTCVSLDSAVWLQDLRTTFVNGCRLQHVVL